LAGAEACHDLWCSNQSLGAGAQFLSGVGQTQIGGAEGLRFEFVDRRFDNSGPLAIGAHYQNPYIALRQLRRLGDQLSPTSARCDNLGSVHRVGDFMPDHRDRLNVASSSRKPPIGNDKRISPARKPRIGLSGL
jgi:hypothetical protein